MAGTPDLLPVNTFTEGISPDSNVWFTTA